MSDHIVSPALWQVALDARVVHAERGRSTAAGLDFLASRRRHRRRAEVLGWQGNTERSAQPSSRTGGAA